MSPRPEVLATWTELSQGYLEDGPPKQRHHKAWLFVNRCELRRRKSGVRYLIRSTGIEIVEAKSKRALAEAVVTFAEQPNVRLLADGLESNDFDTLPRRDDDPDQSIVDGTSDLYGKLSEAADDSP